MIASRARAEAGALRSPQPGFQKLYRDDVQFSIRRVPTPPQLRWGVRSNVRRHVIRAFARVVVLALTDATVAILTWRVLHSLRTTSGLYASAQAVVPGVNGNELFTGLRVAASIIVGLVVAGGYASGEVRRDAGRLWAGVSLGLGLHFWQQLWTTSFASAGTRYIIAVIILTPVVAASRSAIDWLRAHTIWRAAARRVLLVGLRNACDTMCRHPAFASRSSMVVLDTVTTDDAHVSAATGSRLAELECVIHDGGIDTVVLCGDFVPAVFERVANAAMTLECQLLSLDTSVEVTGVDPSIVWRAGHPFLEWRAPTLRASQFLVKRVLDFVVSGVLLVLITPLMATIALLIRFDSPGPIIFGHERLGRHGQRFRCWKFRSMYRDAEARLRSDAKLWAEYVRNDYKLPEDRDPRVTPVGRFLRRTSLDELPQLWNVFCGEMSLVGPRPIVPEEIAHYQDEGPLLLSLAPGITGAWQVSGRSSLAYPKRAMVELEYVQRWSLANDLRLLLKTIPAVLAQRGAH